LLKLAAYNKALRLDQYFAVVYFQKGVSHFIMGDMEAAMQDFDDAYAVSRPITSPCSTTIYISLTDLRI
jgi:tetratricopeptide (TPR) repeat protein